MQTKRTASGSISAATCRSISAMSLAEHEHRSETLVLSQGLPQRAVVDADVAERQAGLACRQPQQEALPIRLRRVVEPIAMSRDSNASLPPRGTCAR